MFGEQWNPIYSILVYVLLHMFALFAVQTKSEYNVHENVLNELLVPKFDLRGSRELKKQHVAIV